MKLKLLFIAVKELSSSEIASIMGHKDREIAQVADIESAIEKLHRQKFDLVFTHPSTDETSIKKLDKLVAFFDEETMLCPLKSDQDLIQQIQNFLADFEKKHAKKYQITDNAFQELINNISIQ